MLMHDDTRKELVRLLELVETRLGRLPAFTYETRLERRKAEQELEYDLEQQEGARFGAVSGGYTVSLAGIRTSSTMGNDSALRNWVVAARKRIGGAL